MRKALTASAAAVAVFAVSACSSSADLDAVDHVQSFVGEQADATWVVLSGDTSPEALDAVDELNAEYWDSDEWPDMADVREWAWNRTQGGETFEVDGSDLADVATDLEDFSGYYVHVLREGNADEVPAAEADAADAVEAARDYVSP